MLLILIISGRRIKEFPRCIPVGVPGRILPLAASLDYIGPLDRRCIPVGVHDRVLPLAAPALTSGPVGFSKFPSCWPPLSTGFTRSLKADRSLKGLDNVRF